MLSKIKLALSSKINSSNRRIIKSTYSLIANQLLRYSLNIFISVWVVRYLGAELFGAFSYIVALAGIVGIFSSLGLQPIVVRELVKNPSESKVLLGTSMFLSLIAGILTFIALVIIVIFINSGEKLLLYLTLIYGFTFIFDTFKFFSFQYESLVQLDKVAKINNYAIIITSALKVLCIYFDLGIYFLVATFILESAISGILLLNIFSKDFYSPIKLLICKETAKSLVKDALPLIMSGFMIGVYMKIDQVMIKNLLGNEETGIFSVAVRLTELFNFMPVILLSTLFPGIVAAKSDVKLFRKKINNLYSILIIFSYAVILFMTIFSSSIIELLYGIDFLEAKTPLMISIWALLFVSLGIARNAYIITFNLTKFYLYTTILGAVFNIGCNIILIPRYGIIGASISTIISYSLSAYFSSLFFKPLRTEFYYASKALFWPKIN